MPQVNPLITTPEEQFVVGESDFAFFGNYACRVEGGAILFCRSGSADATVNQYQGQVRRNTMVLLLPGSIFMLTDRTEDFRAAYCSFSRDLFSEAAFRMDPSFFHALRERPISHPPQRIVEGASIWLQMAAYTYRDRGNVFRNTIIKNRLQNLLLERCQPEFNDTFHHAEAFFFLQTVGCRIGDGIIPVLVQLHRRQVILLAQGIDAQILYRDYREGFCFFARTDLVGMLPQTKECLL